MDPLLNLGIALGLGLMIGSERGWQERRAEEGSRVAPGPICTFGLSSACWASCGHCGAGDAAGLSGEMARSFLPGLVLVLAVGGVFLLF